MLWMSDIFGRNLPRGIEFFFASVMLCFDNTYCEFQLLHHKQKKLSTTPGYTTPASAPAVHGVNVNACTMCRTLKDDVTQIKFPFICILPCISPPAVLNAL
jgi:hypothetical protein